jgi:hypothetical protein
MTYRSIVQPGRDRLGPGQPLPEMRAASGLAAAAIRPHGGFDARAQIELLEQMFDMNLDRALGNTQFPRDQLVALAVRDVLQNLAFLIRQPGFFKVLGRGLSRSEEASSWVRRSVMAILPRAASPSRAIKSSGSMSLSK